MYIYLIVYFILVFVFWRRVKEFVFTSSFLTLAYETDIIVLFKNVRSMSVPYSPAQDRDIFYRYKLPKLDIKVVLYF